eukprot:1311740-Prorocentrum_lima.AAC.1
MRMSCCCCAQNERRATGMANGCGNTPLLFVAPSPQSAAKGPPPQKRGQQREDQDAQELTGRERQLRDVSLQPLDR